MLLNQIEIRLNLPFSDGFGTERTLPVWFQINQKIVNTILFRFDLIRFRKKILWVYTMVPLQLYSKKYISIYFQIERNI